MYTHTTEYKLVNNQWIEISSSETQTLANEIEFDLDSIQNVLKFLNIQVIDSAALREKNVVLICRQDFIELFGENSVSQTSVRRYLQIADKVYRVMIGPLQMGCLGISNLQKESLENSEAITNTANTSQVCVQPFDTSTALKNTLKTANICVDQSFILPNNREKILVYANDIRSKIMEKLKPEFLQTRLPFSIQFPWGEMRGEVFKLNPANSLQGKKIVYGEVNDNTRIRLHPIFSSSQVVIVDKIYNEEISHFEFKIEIVKRLHSAKSTALPLFISADEIKGEILKNLTGKVICKGYEVNIPHSSGWDIRVKLDRAVLHQKEMMSNKDVIEDEELNDGYVLNKSACIRLSAKATEASLTQGPPKIPDQITFKVANIPEGAVHPSINLERERWVDLNELLDKLKLMNKPFTLNECFEVSLNSGTYTILVSKVFSSEKKSIDHTDSYLQTWSLPESNAVLFEAESDLEVNLIRGKKALPLSKATFQVKVLNGPENDSLVTAAELKELIALQGPKVFVPNQSFELRTSGSHILELKLVENEFKGEIEFAKHETSFAHIDKDTDITFSCNITEQIRVVHKVYGVEIEKMKFVLTPIRRQHVNNYVRTPLVLDHDKTISKIRNELNLYKYILEGFSFKIPYGDGWDIDVKFLNATLKPEHKSGGFEANHFNLTSRKGFSPSTDVQIEFVPNMKDIILAADSCIPATSVQLKVIEISENHIKDPDTILKGNWVNLEELKNYLIKMNKPFSKQEKFVADLDTGKFVFEISNAKAKKDQIQKNTGSRSRFLIGENTNVGISVESKLSLQKVKSDAKMPLKKVEFLVYPDQVGSEQICVKEKDIIKAIRDYIKFPLVKKHQLSITTDSFHKLKLDVQEMIPNKIIKGEKDEFLGLIDLQTEIIIKGKEKSNLSINSIPKILEAKDPRAYLEDLGVGGLDKQLNQILRIFLTRSEDLSEEVARRGIKPVKGILLYGPPGTGKTSLGKQIGTMLGCSGERLQMLTGTEIYNMWFGNSEQKVRDLFKPARDAFEKFGAESPLYVIIIDEFDSISKERGSGNSDTTDSITNQLLYEVDGLKSLNNVMIIGITNNKDKIDSAILRKGRIGEHIEVPLPEIKGRESVFRIHMKTLIEEGLLHKDVKIEELADMTENFSGADIQGLITEAAQFSLERLNALEVKKEEYRNHEAGIITMKDFERAIDLKLKTMKGSYGMFGYYNFSMHS